MAAMWAVRAGSFFKRSVPSSCRGFSTEIEFRYTSVLPAAVLKKLTGKDWVPIPGKSYSPSFSALVAVKSFKEPPMKLSDDPGTNPPNWVKRNDELPSDRGGLVRLPLKRKLYTVIRGPFVHKKSKEQFETVTRKHIYVLKAKTAHELKLKLFWLKRTSR